MLNLNIMNKFMQLVEDGKVFKMAPPDKVIKGRGFERVKVDLRLQFFSRYAKMLPESHFTKVGVGKSGGFVIWEYVMSHDAMAYYKILIGEESSTKHINKFNKILIESVK